VSGRQEDRSIDPLDLESAFRAFEAADAPVSQQRSLESQEATCVEVETLDTYAMEQLRHGTTFVNQAQRGVSGGAHQPNYRCIASPHDHKAPKRQL
jgi:hypothetical protein